MNRYGYATIVGAALFLFQLWCVAKPQISALNPHIWASSAESLRQPSSIVPLLVLCTYALIGVASHAAPLLFATKVHMDLQTRGPNPVRTLLSHRGALTLTLGATVVLMVIANHFLFPNSLALSHSDLLIEQRASIVIVYGLPIIFAVALGYWFLQLLDRRIQLAAIALFTGLGAAAWVDPVTRKTHGPPREKPDVIVIGVDSLRPDHLRAFGFPGPSPAPTIDALVSNSIHFERTYTPLARTFVSYTSLLTGQYPTTHGARENLYPMIRIDRQTSIAKLLGEQGYVTLFAMDESRFANFDRGFGFDRVITPPAGMVDFIAGAILDTVGTNLLLLLPHADWVLPHVAGNRAAANTYQPETHSDRLARNIDALESNQPWLLVSHFCMAHWPYVRGVNVATTPPHPFEDSPAGYRAALSVADAQVKKLLSQLEALGRLDNAIVVFLSDHGEALGMDKDTWRITESDGRTHQFAPRGHGKPALDPSQSRVLLSFQRYRDGTPVWIGATATQTVSLVDVAPTLLQLVGVNTPDGKFDGKPLLTNHGVISAPVDRPVFVESGVSGVSLQSEHIDGGEVANELGHLYSVANDYRIEMSDTQIPFQLQNKQRAVIYGNYGLSSDPGLRGKANCWLKLNLITKRAQCLPLSTDDVLVQTYKPMLCRHFSSDRIFHDHWCKTQRSEESFTSIH